MEKLTERFLKAQIERLKTLPRGEDQPWGNEKSTGLRDELLRALKGQVDSNIQAEALVNALMEQCKFCPTPAELIAVSTEQRSSSAPIHDYKTPSITRCSECGDTGFRQVTRTVGGIPYAFSKPCDHANA